MSTSRLVATLLLAVAGWVPALANATTIVLVHGAFADASSWVGVIQRLSAKGWPVMAVANPLRGVKADAAQLSAVLGGIEGPVVLVGHSYGGLVISNATARPGQVLGLVFVAVFAPEAGESAAALSTRFPGSTLGGALAAPVPLPEGGVDLYIRPDRFRDQFAADVPRRTAHVMAATQRPITEAALQEVSGEPAWKQVPSWFVYGDGDRNIPAAALAFMARRANARETRIVAEGSHVVMVSHPQVVAGVIERAARAGR